MEMGAGGLGSDSARRSYNGKAYICACASSGLCITSAEELSHRAGVAGLDLCLSQILRMAEFGVLSVEGRLQRETLWRICVYCVENDSSSSSGNRYS